MSCWNAAISIGRTLRTGRMAGACRQPFMNTWTVNTVRYPLQVPHTAAGAHGGEGRIHDVAPGARGSSGRPRGPGAMEPPIARRSHRASASSDGAPSARFECQIRHWSRMPWAQASALMSSVTFSRSAGSPAAARLSLTICAHGVELGLVALARGERAGAGTPRPARRGVRPGVDPGVRDRVRRPVGRWCRWPHTPYRRGSGPTLIVPGQKLRRRPKTTTPGPGGRVSWMVGWGRFELPASSSRTRRAAKLRHHPKSGHRTVRPVRAVMRWRWAGPGVSCGPAVLSSPGLAVSARQAFGVGPAVHDGVGRPAQAEGVERLDEPPVGTGSAGPGTRPAGGPAA